MKVLNHNYALSCCYSLQYFLFMTDMENKPVLSLSLSLSLPFLITSTVSAQKKKRDLHLRTSAGPSVPQTLCYGGRIVLR